MTTRFATTDEIRKWHELLLQNPDGGNVFQTVEFSKVKATTGWKPHYIISGDIALVALEKNVPLLGKYWYVLKGPGVVNGVQIRKIAKSLHDFAKQNGVFAVKIEPEALKSSVKAKDLADLPVIKGESIQPSASTIIVDLEPNIDNVLAGFSQRARRYIRKAASAGVEVTTEDATPEACKRFFELYSETAAGQFKIREYSYYQDFWQTLGEAGYGKFFFAHYEGRVVAGEYVTLFGQKAIYKDGGSVRNDKAPGASYALQWESIKWAKENGATSYDFYGSPPSDRIDDKSHPFYGIGAFKLSFVKDVTDFTSALDIVVNPAKYRLWKKLVERIVRKLSWKLKHENWY